MYQIPIFDEDQIENSKNIFRRFNKENGSQEIEDFNIGTMRAHVLNCIMALRILDHVYNIAKKTVFVINEATNLLTEETPDNKSQTVQGIHQILFEKAVVTILTSKTEDLQKSPFLKSLPDHPKFTGHRSFSALHWASFLGNEVLSHEDYILLYSSNPLDLSRVYGVGRILFDDVL